MIGFNQEYMGQYCLELLPRLSRGDGMTDVDNVKAEMRKDTDGITVAQTATVKGDNGKTELVQDTAGQVMRELKEVHAVFDALGVEKGYAADRLAAWFRRKIVSFRANGHTDSCQCGICGENRVVQGVLRDLRL